MKPKKTGTPKIQQALKHSTGTCDAASVWQLNSEAEIASALDQVAGLIQLAETPGATAPGNLFILTAVSPALLATLDVAVATKTELAAASSADWVNETSKRVFVQVCAQTEIDRLIGLRIVEAALSAHFSNEQEWIGGRLLHGVEPLGFYEGSAGDVTWSAQSKPYQWLLVQAHEYKTQAFFDATHDPSVEQCVRNRMDVVGKPPALLPEDPKAAAAPGVPNLRQHAEAYEHSVFERDSAAGPSSKVAHAVAMAAFKDNLKRRGFVVRQAGKDALLFVAASNDASTLVAALHAFSSRDKLKQYTTPSAPLLFCSPSHAGVLSRNPAKLKLPASAEPLLHGPDMVNYAISTHDLDYMMALAAVSLQGDRWQSVDPKVAKKFKELHALLEKRRVNPEKSLDQLLAEFEGATNQINQLAGRYITKT